MCPGATCICPPHRSRRPSPCVSSSGRTAVPTADSAGRWRPHDPASQYRGGRPLLAAGCAVGVRPVARARRRGVLGLRHQGVRGGAGAVARGRRAPLVGPARRDAGRCRRARGDDRARARRAHVRASPGAARAEADAARPLRRLDDGAVRRPCPVAPGAARGGRQRGRRGLLERRVRGAGARDRDQPGSRVAGPGARARRRTAGRAGQRGSARAARRFTGTGTGAGAGLARSPGSSLARLGRLPWAVLRGRRAVLDGAGHGPDPTRGPGRREPAVAR